MREKILDIELEVIGFPQRIIECGAAAQRDFTFVLRVSRTNDKSLFRMLDLNKKGDQLGGAVSDNDILRFGSAVCSDASAQRGVLPVRIAGNGVDLIGQRVF